MPMLKLSESCLRNLGGSNSIPGTSLSKSRKSLNSFKLTRTIQAVINFFSFFSVLIVRGFIEVCVFFQGEVEGSMHICLILV